MQYLCVNEFGSWTRKRPRVLEHPQPNSAEDYRAMKYSTLPGNETSGTIDVQRITDTISRGDQLW